MKKNKYMSMYKTWIKSGNMPKGGLCPNLGEWDGLEWDFSKNKLFLLMMPFEYKTGGTDFWAGGGIYDFNPLRQNIILFMAAMNNEL